MSDKAIMSDEAKELRRAYKREWNRKNKDKIKAAQARYWQNKAAALQRTQQQTN